MSKRGAAKSAPAKPSWTIPPEWMTIHPVENHGKLQADVNRLMVTESKLKKKIAAEEDASKAARIVRDYLAKARVLLISLKPTITISEAHHHPLVNSELPCFLSFFDSRFSISNRTIRLHLPMQLQERRDALPVLGCSRGRLSVWDVL
jgi:hypothetical protein